MSEQNKQGTIKTRSGTWDWKLTSLRSWPKSDVTGKRLGFEDPTNAVHAMSLHLEPDDEELSEKSIRDLSLAPLKRRFQDGSGTVWIAHPVDRAQTIATESVVRVSLHSLEHGSRTVDLPPGRTLGDLKEKELLALVKVDGG